MTEKMHKTQLGDIHYWINILNKDSVTLVFLPGLTADHRLFEKTIDVDGCKMKRYWIAV